MTTGVASRTELRDRLAAVVGATLRVNVGHIGPFDSLSSLGMDSLAAVELTAAIEDELGIELSLTVVHEHPNLDALCRFIEGDDSDSPREREMDRMRGDAILPPDIVPCRGGCPAMRDARRILLTGATGFLGAHLLRMLLDETPATVYCLVRSGAGAGDGLDRVRRNLAAYDLWSDSEAARVRVVSGDLRRPLLGHDPRSFHEMAIEIDAIVHAGAEVNWVRGYESLRDANVYGTRELLRLACDGTAKPLHFVSSVSVCHSTAGPPIVDEGTEVFAGLGGLWLGYAQSKCVAESLVREAGARGLSVTIVRPSLITGDASRGGRSNVDDLTSRFIAGCIRMGAAPDLDWRMDCVPADDASRAIVRLALSHDAGAAVHHVASSRPRHWRECVLWMRLRGYEVELLPYAEWVERLRVTVDATHPLSGLRPFFMRRLSTENGLTLPELFEESRRSRVDSTKSKMALDALGVRVHDVDSQLLSHYFDDFVRRGTVPEAGSSRVARPADESPVLVPGEALEKGLSDWLGERVRVEGVSISPVATEESIVAELTAWRSGTQAGLFHATVNTRTDDDTPRNVRLFVKAKSPDTESIDVAVALAGLASPTLREEVRRFSADLGLTRSHLRELAIYQLDDPRIRAHTPRCVLIDRDDARRRWVVVLESIDDVALINANDPSAWNDASIDAALSGLASIHSAWLARRSELLHEPWLAPPRDNRKWVEMSPLWHALAEHAHSRSPAFAVRGLRRVHREILEDIASWTDAIAAAPRTLIHNDFNPRNVALRRDANGPRLCAFDWELATIGAPQRDLAEFLSFVMPPDAPQEAIARWIERYRLLLTVGSGTVLPRAEWEAGFRAAMCELLVDRLAFYAMIDRVRPQSFLPRVVRSWMNVFGGARPSLRAEQGREG
ncbi:MAG TPA: thioester reductase domain-containing protein [Gemmatimonadaceae bacterium]|nr:thioester reductase domain-containing protein [Gemmatimonadaceae bacterium]